MIFSETTSYDPEPSHENALRFVLERMAKDESVQWGEVRVVVLGDEDHKGLNNKYLGHDYSTDILTFDLSESDQMEAEIYINEVVCRSNAFEYGVSFDHELNRLMIHGLLHLVGHKDGSKEEQADMRLREDGYLQLLSENGFM